LFAVPGPARFLDRYCGCVPTRSAIDRVTLSQSRVFLQLLSSGFRYLPAQFAFSLMDNLSQQKCVPCSGNVSRLSPAEIADLAPQVPEWEIAANRDRLQRVYPFRNFQEAIAFAVLIGSLAEEENHHPTLLVEWGKVTVTWWTHAIDGLHQNDFVMAAKSDRVARHMQKLTEDLPLPANVGSKLAKL